MLRSMYSKEYRPAWAVENRIFCFSGDKMTPEQRLYLSVVLNAIAEQDQNNVTGVPKENRARLADEAREWFADGSEMKELCDQANLPYEELRKLTPSRAKYALSVLDGGNQLLCRRCGERPMTPYQQKTQPNSGWCGVCLNPGTRRG